MLKKRRRKTKEKNLSFNFVSPMEEMQLKIMESYQYFQLFEQDIKDKTFTLREILNIFKFRVHFLFLFGNFKVG
jgi:hypothetical protein